jgi:hypothetical protein
MHCARPRPPVYIFLNATIIHGERESGILPFAATSAGAAFTAFALSLLAHDGLLALIAMAVISTTVVLMLNGLVL